MSKRILNPTPEAQKLLAKFARKHNRLRNQMSSPKRNDDTALKVIEAMTEENLAFKKIGYWYDDANGRWTNEPRPPLTEKQKKFFDLRKKAFAGDGEAALEYLKQLTGEMADEVG